jgi:DUF971 family protein
MTRPPQDIKSKRSERVLEIIWDDGVRDRLGMRFLRGRCACANCVDEFTGVRRVDVGDVPEDVSVDGMELVGNYAVKITWSDGHDSGMYTWERLRHLAGEAGGSDDMG